MEKKEIEIRKLKEGEGKIVQQLWLDATYVFNRDSQWIHAKSILTSIWTYSYLVAGSLIFTFVFALNSFTSFFLSFVLVTSVTTLRFLSFWKNLQSGLIGLPDTLLNAEQFFSGQRRAFFVATINGRIVGSIGFCEHSDADTAEMKQFIVDSDYRRAGVGSRLFSVFKEEVKKRNYKRIVLHTDDGLPTGIAFYRKHGFQKYHSYVMAQQHPFTLTGIWYSLQLH